MKKWAYTDKIIAPSLLAADFRRLADETTRAIRCGADWLHLDIMDGHFVDNISFGPAVVQTIHETNDIFLDVHLMISDPAHYYPRFIDAGADLITIHVEVDSDIAKILEGIRDEGCQAGLAVNPSTPIEAIEPYLEQIDLLLCMTVVPGFGGQAFMPEVLPKIERTASYRSQRELVFHIEVDGGIYPDSATKCSQAGANVFVGGSSTFKAQNMQEAIRMLRGE